MFIILPGIPIMELHRTGSLRLSNIGFFPRGSSFILGLFGTLMLLLVDELPCALISFIIFEAFVDVELCIHQCKGLFSHTRITARGAVQGAQASKRFQRHGKGALCCYWILILTQESVSSPCLTSCLKRNPCLCSDSSYSGGSP